MFVKICGTTTEEDALLAVAMGADAVGFVFAPSRRQVAPDRVRDIVRRLPAETLTVGVFRDELPARVLEVMGRTGLRAAQLHGGESAEVTARIADQVPLMIKAFPAGHPGLGHVDDYGADAILVDSARPGSGEVFDWSLAEDAPRAGHRVILAGGLDPDNVADGIAAVRPWGVDVASGVEADPGHKDPFKVKAFVAAARAAFAEHRSPVAASTGPGPYDWQDDLLPDG